MLVGAEGDTAKGALGVVGAGGGNGIDRHRLKHCGNRLVGVHRQRVCGICGEGIPLAVLPFGEGISEVLHGIQRNLRTLFVGSQFRLHYHAARAHRAHCGGQYILRCRGRRTLQRTFYHKVTHAAALPGRQVEETHRQLQRLCGGGYHAADRGVYLRDGYTLLLAAYLYVVAQGLALLARTHNSRYSAAVCAVLEYLKMNTARGEIEPVLGREGEDHGVFRVRRRAESGTGFVVHSGISAQYSAILILLEIDGTVDFHLAEVECLAGKPCLHGLGGEDGVFVDKGISNVAAYLHAACVLRLSLHIHAIRANPFARCGAAVPRIYADIHALVLFQRERHLFADGIARLVHHIRLLENLRVRREGGVGGVVCLGAHAVPSVAQQGES